MFISKAEREARKIDAQRILVELEKELAIEKEKQAKLKDKLKSAIMDEVNNLSEWTDCDEEFFKSIINTHILNLSYENAYQKVKKEFKDRYRHNKLYNEWKSRACKDGKEWTRENDENFGRWYSVNYRHE